MDWWIYLCKNQPVFNANISPKSKSLIKKQPTVFSYLVLVQLFSRLSDKQTLHNLLLWWIRKHKNTYNIMVCIEYASYVSLMRTLMSASVLPLTFIHSVPRSDETTTSDPLLCSRDGKALQAI